MTTTSKPQDETGKPEMKPAAVTSSASTPPAATPAQPKLESKRAVKIQNPIKPMNELSTFKSSPINPAWTEEVASSFGLTGRLAKEVATELTTELSDAISSKFTRPKLAKLVRAAVTRSIQ